MFFKDQISEIFKKFYTIELHVYPCMYKVPEWVGIQDGGKGLGAALSCYTLLATLISSQSCSTMIHAQNPSLSELICSFNHLDPISQFDKDFMSGNFHNGLFLVDTKSKSFPMLTICNYSHTILTAAK